MRAIAWEGRFLVVGFASGEDSKLPLNLTLLKGCDHSGRQTGAPSCSRNRGRYRAGLPTSSPAGARKGKLSCHIHAVYPLAEMAQALKDIAGRIAMGKVIVRP